MQIQLVCSGFRYRQILIFQNYAYFNLHSDSNFLCIPSAYRHVLNPYDFVQFSSLVNFVALVKVKYMGRIVTVGRSFGRDNVWSKEYLKNVYFWSRFDVRLWTGIKFSKQIKQVILNSFKHFSWPKFSTPRTCVQYFSVHLRWGVEKTCDITKLRILNIKVKN